MYFFQNLCVLALLLVGVLLAQATAFSVGHADQLYDAALDSGADHANVGARRPRQQYAYSFPGGFVQGSRYSGPGFSYSSQSAHAGDYVDDDY